MAPAIKVIKVVDKLNQYILESRERHSQHHQVKEGVAEKNILCCGCRKPILQGAKIFLCEYVSEWDGSLSRPYFCDGKCHNEWLVQSGTFRGEIMHSFLLQEMANLQAFIEIFEGMFHNVKVGFGGGEVFGRIIDSLELPTIDWEGIVLDDSETEHLKVLTSFSLEIVQGSIRSALGIS